MLILLLNRPAITERVASSGLIAPEREARHRVRSSYVWKLIHTIADARQLLCRIRKAALTRGFAVHRVNARTPGLGSGWQSISRLRAGSPDRAPAL